MYVGLQLRSPTRDRTKTKSLPDFTFARARSYILYSDLSVGTRGNSAVWTEPFWYAVSYFCIELVGFVPMPPESLPPIPFTPPPIKSGVPASSTTLI